MSNVPPPAPAYAGPARWHGGDQSGIHRLVVHGTVSPTMRGGARTIAAYFRNVSRPASAHYVVDPYETLQVVYDHTVAYHAPPNEGSIGIELCDPVAGSPSRWNDVAHRLMVRRAARLVARLALAYDVPLVKVGPDALVHNGGRGICGHVDVSQAWHETTHTDPGPDFPWDRFMRIARRRAKYLQAYYAAKRKVLPS